MAIYKGSTLLTGGSLNNFTSYTTTQRDALTPSEGDVIFNSTDSVLQLYNGTTWDDIQTAAPSISGNKVHYLVIAGGGGGGTNRGAGGGAGGYRTTWDGVGDGSGDEISGGGNDPEDTLTLANGTYTITVGAGASTDDREGTGRLRGGIGSNSVFSTITSNGGGGGGWGGSPKSGSSNALRSGSDGGSGGGAGGQYSSSSTNGTPGSGTANQGFDGGTVTGGSQIFEGAGGGGAGSAAPNATTSYYYSPYNHLSSTGGDGLESTITGTATFRASGGAGFGREPQDGGGGGGSDSSTSASRGNNDGVSNTGGGAGQGGQGGSGLVVLRFAGGRSYSTTGGTVTASDADNGDKILTWTGSGTITFS